MNNILELHQVCKAFPKQKNMKSAFTLDHVSFSLPYGAILGFVGENGAGKTTTIGCILNTIVNKEGTIKLFGRQMRDADTDLRERIGVVYDSDNFPSYWTPTKLSQIMQGFYKTWDASLFQSYLDRFKLPAGLKIKHYSRGMSMKLAIAAAISHHPQLLILDEATSGLDPVMRDEMLDVFLEFVQEEDHSILLSSHITSDLEKIADYIVFIHDGKIILTASKNDLVYNYAVMRLKESQFQALDPDDILAFRKRDLQIDVLVSNGKEAAGKYKDVVIDHTSIDEIMLLLIKGEQV
ncbi:ABC transporter ATP-binding protein [Lachnospiraceae bacterium 10-1]|nr:ABC transporter ATP-binding protein [Lachnospiraceae bacterium 10-1]